MTFACSFRKAAPLLVLFMLPEKVTLWAEPWKFGVMGNTQWTTADPTGENSSTVPVSIIDQINRQFIKAGVKFVIQVGDLSDEGREVSEEVRLEVAQPLIDAGIGFFAFRGNHEAKSAENGYGAPGFRKRYRQTRGGGFRKGNGNSFTVGSNFSSPVQVSCDLDGLSYSLDCGEGKERTRFVIIDNWPVPGRVVPNSTHYPSGYTITDQQPWISERLALIKRGGAPHAFVFSHQSLIGQNHQDTLFSGYADEHSDWQNAFFPSLHTNGIRLFICGHDHLHQRSIIHSPDGKSQVEQLIAASVSSKFYTPKVLDDARWRGQKNREIPVSQEFCAVGYYIVTIEGPKVTVEYYADDHGGWQSDTAYPQGVGCPDTGRTPTFHFVLKERWIDTLDDGEVFPRVNLKALTEQFRN